MTQLKLGESQIARRLFKSAATSALALSTFTIIGAILNGDKAVALTCDFGPTPVGIFNCTYGPQWPGTLAPKVGYPVPAGPVPPATIPPGPKRFYEQWLETNFIGQAAGDLKPKSYYYPTDKDIWFISGPNEGSGIIDWYWQDVNNSGTWLIPPDNHSVDQWHVDVDFDPDFQVGEIPPPLAKHTSVFKYVVIIDKGQGGVTHLNFNDYFEDVTLGAIFGPPPAPGPFPPILSSVKKDIYTAICTSSTPGGIFDSCTRGDFIDSLYVDPTTPAIDYSYIERLKLDRLWIEDTAEANDYLIDAYQNVYRQTPGPLPILGAGAAFSFSRKLRSRIKASRTA